MKNALLFVFIFLFFGANAQQGSYTKDKTEPKKANSEVNKPVKESKQADKPKNTSSNVVTLKVFPEMESCPGNPNQQCLKIQNLNNNEIEYVEDVENLSYDLGYTYKIQVKQLERNVYIDGQSPYNYVWIKTLSKTEEESNYIDNTPNTNLPNIKPNEIKIKKENGNIVGVTDIPVNSPIDGIWYLRKLKEAEGSSIVTDDNVMWIEIKSFSDQLNGFGACNKFDAVVRSDLKTSFLVSKITPNLSVCGNDKVEKLFFALLEQTDKFEVKNDILILSKQWNFLLGFTKNRENKEDIPVTYTPQAIIKTNEQTYATDAILKKDNYGEAQNSYKKSEYQETTTTKINNEPTITTTTQISSSSPNVTISDKDKQIAELQKQLDDAKKAKADEELRQQQLADQNAKIEEQKQQQLKQQKEAAEKAALELKKKQEEDEKDKQIAALKKQLEEQQKEMGVTSKNSKVPNTTTTKSKTTTESTSVKQTKSDVPATDNEDKGTEEKYVEKPKVVSDYVITQFTKNTSKTDLPEPEFPNRPYYLDGKELAKLERSEANFAVKKKGVYRGVDKQVQIMKEESPIQFLKNNLPRFIIKLEDEDVDPYDVIDLCKADRIGKGRRNFTYAGIKYGGRVKDVTGKLVQLDFKKISKGVYEIIIEGDLQQGEYAFLPLFKSDQSLSSTNSIKANCFGIVDPE